MTSLNGPLDQAIRDALVKAREAESVTAEALAQGQRQREDSIAQMTRLDIRHILARVVEGVSEDPVVVDFAAGEDVQAAILRVIREEGAGALSPDAEAALHRERNFRRAKGALDREEAAAAMKLPPERESYSLASYVGEEKPPKIDRVANLQGAGHKALLVASYKTGKSTLDANLARSLVDGVPFLGCLDVTPIEGTVGVWNGEMNGPDYEKYLVDAGVVDQARVMVWNLRSCRVPLLSDAGRDAAVEWLTDNGVAYWIVEPWSKVCAWSGVDENRNAEVGPLLQRVDEIAEAAGVGELLIVHHAGWAGGRPRGASTLGDWPDAIWTYSKGEGDDEDQRYLKAEGRDVDLSEGLVTLDAGVTTYHEGVGRKIAKADKLVSTIVAIVEDAPDGIGTTTVQDGLSGANAAKTAAVRRAVDMGLIRQEPDPEDRRKKLLFPRSDSAVLPV